MNNEQLQKAYQDILNIQKGVQGLYEQKGLKYTPVVPFPTQPNKTNTSTNPAKVGSINVNDMNTTPVSLPQQAPDTSTASLSGFLGAYGQNFGQPQTPTATTPTPTRNDILARIMQNIGLQGTQAQRAAEIQDQLGVNEKQQQLSDLESKYLTTQRSYENQLRDLEVQSGGTVAANRAAQQILSRDANRELADIAIQRSVALQDYTTASDIAERKIAAEFEPLKTELTGLQNLYNLMQNDLTESERLIASANISQKADQIKTMESTKMALTQSLIDNGRADLIKKLDLASSPSEMIAIAGKYGISVSEQLDTQIKLAQLKKLSLETLALEDSDIVDVDTAAALAAQYAETGTLPVKEQLELANLTAGDIANIAKQTSFADGAILSKATGLKSKSLSASQEDGLLAMYDILKKADQLKTLDEARIKGVLPAAFGKVFGSSAQGAYMSLRKEIVDLISRARTGAALTASEEAFYSDMLPGRVGQGFFGLFGQNTQKVIDNFKNKIQSTLDTKLAGSNLVINGYSTVNVGGIQRKVGEILDIGGVKVRVLADGTLSTNI